MFEGSHASAVIDGDVMGTGTIMNRVGMVGLQSGWHAAEFDVFSSQSKDLKGM